MKKFLAIALAAVMVCGIIPMVSATTNWTNGTEVTFNGTGTEAWTVTVPATMAPGETKQVEIAGTWGTDREMTIGVTKNTVDLTNELSGGDVKTLTVTFPTEVIGGNNVAAISKTKDITVGAISDALFGTWTGTVVYTVAVADVAAAG